MKIETVAPNPPRHAPKTGRALFLALGLLLSPAAARDALADDPAPPPAGASPEKLAEILAGHSLHGGAFNEGPRQKAYLMEGMPNVVFPITTKVELAQRFFNQGVGQLHGFWYFEAERSFRQVASLDTNCAMAYWGMAMANANNDTRAKEFIKKATELKAGAGKREGLWIGALAKYYEDEKAGNKRHRDYVRSLENIVLEFPDDIEAKAFLVLKIWDNDFHDNKVSSHIALDALAAQVLAANPMHPLHHYRIHFWNYEKDALAVNSAARCGQSGPGIAHLWHMPGHTFTKLNRYADAAWQQEASARVDHAHMIRDRVLPDQIHNYAHNNEWLVQNLEFLGRVKDGLELAENLIELPRHPQYNNLMQGSGTNTYQLKGGSARYGRDRLLETLVRFEQWDQTINLADTVYLEPTDILEEQIKRLRVLGLAYFGKGDTANGRKQIETLREILRTQRVDRQKAGDEAEAKARKEKLADDKIAKAMTDALMAHAGKINRTENVLNELGAYEALAEKKPDAAREKIEAAKDLPKERLALVYLEIGDKEKAEKLAKEAYEGGTNQVQVLANYCDVLWRVGKQKEAQERFEQLRTVAAHADADLPIFKRLEPVRASLNLGEKWRYPALKAPDIGDRPNLENLGPFHWRPSPAPDWSLNDSTGKPVSLKDYRGKPVVVIFYLGHGCPHCIQQLNAFAPANKEFAEAGISIVAISTDSVAGLKKTFEKTDPASPIPFPILSDEKLEAFKAYRAYDDFETMALHGTYLIDGEGLVRWQDISYEPFKDTYFLLRESKRLLKQSGKPTLAQTKAP